MASIIRGSQGYAVGEEARPSPDIWRPAFGLVLFECMIETRCYPWKSPRIGRGGAASFRNQPKSYRSWKSWSTDITMVLPTLYRLDHHAMVEGPVDLDMLFVTDPRRKPADRTNLGKALEDILQGIVYANDRQVRGGDVRRVFLGEPVYGREGQTWQGPERVHFRVTSLA